MAPGMEELAEAVKTAANAAKAAAKAADAAATAAAAIADVVLRLNNQQPNAGNRSRSKVPMDNVVRVNDDDLFRRPDPPSANRTKRRSARLSLPPRFDAPVTPFPLLPTPHPALCEPRVPAHPNTRRDWSDPEVGQRIVAFIGRKVRAQADNWHSGNIPCEFSTQEAAFLATYADVSKIMTRLKYPSFETSYLTAEIRRIAAEIHRLRFPNQTQTAKCSSSNIAWASVPLLHAFRNYLNHRRIEQLAAESSRIVGSSITPQVAIGAFNNFVAKPASRKQISEAHQIDHLSNCTTEALEFRIRMNHFWVYHNSQYFNVSTRAAYLKFWKRQEEERTSKGERSSSVHDRSLQSMELSPSSSTSTPATTTQPAAVGDSRLRRAASPTLGEMVVQFMANRKPTTNLDLSAVKRDDSPEIIIEPAEQQLAAPTATAYVTEVKRESEPLVDLTSTRFLDPEEMEDRKPVILRDWPRQAASESRQTARKSAVVVPCEFNQEEEDDDDSDNEEELGQEGGDGTEERSPDVAASSGDATANTSNVEQNNGLGAISDNENVEPVLDSKIIKREEEETTTATRSQLKRKGQTADSAVTTKTRRSAARLAEAAIRQSSSSGRSRSPQVNK